MRHIDRIIVHHSASPRSTTVQTIRGWHVGKGWRDIGYHFVIDGTGNIIPCRPIDETGAHDRGENAGSVGVCITGNNCKLGDEWDDVQKMAFTVLRDSLDTVLGRTLKVEGHRDNSATPGAPDATLCPGVDVLELWG